MTHPEYSMTHPLEDKRILVAGGTSGVGRALVTLLAAEKADVTALGRSPEKLASLKQELPSVKGFALDARDRQAMDDFFPTQPPFDHLVLALSGGKGGGPFKELLLADLQEGFSQKFWPQLQTLQASLPFMNPRGSVTFVTAISATAGLPGTSGLAAINGALELMVPILAKELKPLRINAVSPGVIDTPWWDFLPAEKKQDVFTDFSAKISVGRVGQPEEVAATIRFILATEYINGVIIGCHGGLG